MVYKYICVSVHNCNKTPKKMGPTHHTVIVLNKRKIYGFQTKATLYLRNIIWKWAICSCFPSENFSAQQKGLLSKRSPIFKRSTCVLFNASTFSGTLAENRWQQLVFPLSPIPACESAALRLQTCTSLIWAAGPIFLMFIVQCFLMFFFYLSAIHSPKSHWKTLYNIII